MRALSLPLCLLYMVVCATVVVAADVSAAPTGTCRVMAMSGGGDKAAYEHGVMLGLIANLPAVEVQYNVMTGISSGSTISTAFSFFEVGDEPNAAALVQSIMNNLNQSAVYQQWPGGVLEGLLLHSALFDSSPLRQLFESHVSGRTVAKSRQVCFGATNLATGGYEPLCNHSTAENVIDHALASAAFPGILESIALANGDAYVDGGVLIDVDVITGVQMCLDQGYSQSQILVDTVETDGLDYSALSGDSTKLTTINIWLRAMALRNFQSAEYTWALAKEAFPNVTYRYHIYPSVPIPGTGFDFDPRMIKYMINLGISDAAYMIHPTEENGEKLRGAQEALKRMSEVMEKEEKISLF